jgi:hypothetical protein
MLNLIDEFTRECLAIRIDRRCDRRTSSTCCRTSSSCEASRITSGLTTARSSWPMRFGNGSPRSAPGRPTSNRAAHGRTATARASTRSSGTNCSTARSSTAWLRRGSSSRSWRQALQHQAPALIPGLSAASAGGKTTTRGTPMCSGRLRHPEPLRRPPQGAVAPRPVMH